MAARKSKTSSKGSKKPKATEIEAAIAEDPPPQDEPDAAGSMIDAGAPDVIDAADEDGPLDDPDDGDAPDPDGDGTENAAPGGPAEVPLLEEIGDFEPVETVATAEMAEDAADAGPAPYIEEVLPDMLPDFEPEPDASASTVNAAEDAVDGGKAPDAGPDAFFEIEDEGVQAEV